MRLLLFAAIFLTFSPVGQSADLFVSTTGSDLATGTADHPFATPTRAIAAWRPGDRIWWIGPGYKLLVSWDARDPDLICPAGPAILPNVDVWVVLRRGGRLTSVPIERRKTDTSTRMPITINKSTTILVEAR